jgi:hypothetical protein
MLGHAISTLRMRRRAARLDRILVQLNDTLTVYAIGLAVLYVVAYWRSLSLR